MVSRVMSGHTACVYDTRSSSSVQVSCQLYLGCYRWTNGYFRSTLHRVVNDEGKERYSTAFFYNPNFNARVECLPQCCKHEAAKFLPTTSGQHVLDMYAAANRGQTSTVRIAEG